MALGARYHPDHTDFTVWAPQRNRVELLLTGSNERTVAMERDHRGYWGTRVDNLPAGARYRFCLDGADSWPDPASAYQPDGVHGASAVVDHDSFAWRDDGWAGMSLRDMVQYELHVGTFTEAGTFDAVIERLDNLKQLGVSAIELLPVAQFPGSRNWGYDGAYPFAVQNSYGGPDGLKRLVDACHARGMAVVLDVVYNHLGPEGNYLGQFAPYFTDKYRTPWGQAVNFDDAWSDGVREYFIRNALYWFDVYHIDALRLDAIHGIFDFSARHILAEMADRVNELAEKNGREYILIAESDLNDVRVIRERSQGGYAVPAQWSDDFHHSVHTLLTGEDKGYYADFGRLADLVKALNDGFVYDWRYSEYRRRCHGSSSLDIPAERFVVFLQNHDQVGNRMLGERLSHLVPFEAAKLAAAVMLTSPYVPMLFMGEEYAETSPFYYFVSHGDPDLVEAVRNGRTEEFRSFGWEQEPPDPQSEETFAASRLRWELQFEGEHKVMRDFYRQLIAYRRTIPALLTLDKQKSEAFLGEQSRIVGLHRTQSPQEILCLFNFSEEPSRWINNRLRGSARKIMDSSISMWNGPGGTAADRLEPGGTVLLPGHGFVMYDMKDSA
ncbi:malto-oligosyltrehalose trehalohydrolase [candidate division GN15 bacterium]|nr:malto-oligosyltrehalose trehalohydrolase [candidate division GN15 bacterium]